MARSESQSYHVLIYGFAVCNKNKGLKPQGIFKQYWNPMYGAKGDQYIGFEYGRIDGMYEQFKSVYDGTLNFFIIAFFAAN